jgi:hypothetical protein
MSARVWFKDPKSEGSERFANSINALNIRNTNAQPSMYDYHPYTPFTEDRYSEKFDHRYTFFLESKNPTKAEQDMKAFILLGKWCGGYVEVSIADMDFYHLGEYIGTGSMDSHLSWEQEEKLKLAGLKHPLDK